MTTPLRKQASWQEHVKRINVAWQKGVDSIIETGQRLIDAKNELEHGSFESMVQMKLPFAPRTAQALMAIAKHPVLSNPHHGALLPPSWRTLDELTRVPVPLLTAKIKDGTITSKLERKDVRTLLPAPKKKKQLKQEKPKQTDDDDAPGDDDQTIWRRGLMFRAREAIGGAQFEDWSHFKVDQDVEDKVNQAADAWNQLAAYLKRLRGANGGDRTEAEVDRWIES
jgi:hypothetical protein